MFLVCNCLHAREHSQAYVLSGQKQLCTLIQHLVPILAKLCTVDKIAVLPCLLLLMSYFVLLCFVVVVNFLLSQQFWPKTLCMLSRLQSHYILFGSNFF